MNRLPFPTFAGLALLLAAAVPARADEPTVAAPVEADAASAETVAVAAPAAAVAVDGPAGQKSEPSLIVDPTTWRPPSSPSRTAKRWVTHAEVDSNSYRLSLSRGKLDLGLGFEAPVGVATRTTRSVDPSGPIVVTLPTLSVGLRSDGAGAPPSSLVARSHAEVSAPSPTRRVGLEWKPAQSDLFVRGGVRLVGDDRITMRLRSGRVGIYMKSTF